MSDADKLFNAKNAFKSGKYAEAAQLLGDLPQDNLKTKHNLAIVKFLNNDIDKQAAIAALLEPATNPSALLVGGDGAGADRAKLLYDGHENAIYNLAILYAHSGLVPLAVPLLRGLLLASDEVALEVLTQALCLMQTLVRSAAKGCPSRTAASSDDDLISSVLEKVMAFIGDNEALVKLVSSAFADSSNIHESFRKTSEGSAAQAVYLNNLGVLSLSDGKANVASLCFIKAEKAAGTSPENRFTLNAAAYNAGIAALLSRRYSAAGEHLVPLQTAMKDSALYWVRLAEAALGCVEEEHQARQHAAYEKQQDAFTAALESGKVYGHLEFLLLPGAVATAGPAQEPLLAAESLRAAATPAEQLAALAVQNSLFLLSADTAPGRTLAAMLAEAPTLDPLMLYAILYWAALERYRQNYAVVAHICQSLLSALERPSGGGGSSAGATSGSGASKNAPTERSRLPASVYASLLCYLVEALTHLNDPERALVALRSAALSSIVVPAAGEQHDAAQRSRVEAIFVNLAVTHILTGSWTQAHSIMEDLLTKLVDSAPEGSLDRQPEKGVIFAYQMLGIFLELAQGNQGKAAELLGKVNWSL